MTENKISSSGDEPPAVAAPDADSGESGIAPGLIRLWFGFQGGVGQKAYALSGFGLMALKYAVEAGVLWAVNSAVFTPIDFLNPVLSAREDLLQGTPEWLGWIWFLWTLPFVWIAVSMSVRRAADAGLSPWMGLLVLVPLFNLITMLLLAVLPHRPGAHWKSSQQCVSAMHQIRSAILGVGGGLVIALTMVGIGIYTLDSYGASLFLGTPVVMSAVAGVIYNAPAPRSVFASMMLGMLTIILAGGALLLFALEGVICLVMAAPITVPLGALGGAIGKAIAETTRRPGQGVAAAIMFLPLWAGVEAVSVDSPEYVVTSSVEIDASPEQVWQYVVDFPELAEPDEWYFRLGIACPMRAEIRGQGVGAERHCIFTTGDFVEPITVWDEPRRLAFDVTEQPPPMFELTPYRHIHPPHLDQSLRSNRGEFRLVPLEGGRTRLEGRTWYEFDMFPQAYWVLWSDLMIHRIHDRVLQHIRRLAEAEQSAD